MTANEKLLGKYLVLEWTPAGGSMITLTTYSRNFSVKQQSKDIDVTVRQDVLDNTEDILAGVPSRDITIAGLDDDENVPDWESVNIGDTGTLVWYRQGKTTGKSKSTISARCTGSDFGSPHDNANDWTITFKGTSAITPGTVA